MDKLKIIKTAVFMLTFCMIFVLCLLTDKVFEQKTSKPFEINITNVTGAKINNMTTSADYLYLQSSNQIHIIDVKKGVYKGTILVTEDK